MTFLLHKENKMKHIINKIEEGILFGKEKGVFLVSENWGNEKQNCACALGCLLLKNEIALDEETNEEEACTLLEVDNAWITAFISGFDDTPWNLKIILTDAQRERLSDEEVKTLEAANDSGKELRKKFDPLPYDKFVDAFVAGQE
jgi:hypothetical protein